MTTTATTESLSHSDRLAIAMGNFREPGVHTHAYYTIHEMLETARTQRVYAYAGPGAAQEARDAVTAIVAELEARSDEYPELRGFTDEARHILERIAGDC